MLCGRGDTPITPVVYQQQGLRYGGGRGSKPADFLRCDTRERAKVQSIDGELLRESYDPSQGPQ